MLMGFLGSIKEDVKYTEKILLINWKHICKSYFLFAEPISALNFYCLHIKALI